MLPSSLLQLLIVLPSLSLAAGLYTKGSPVLQVDAKNYDSVIAKSNYTSIVEFYAPWCGHCKNLKPAYEKAATSLSGLAKVAAVNCDEDSNKAFCGSLGVQGFPTLKIVKPSKKPGGKGVPQDYPGERSTKAIVDAVKDKIMNHVTKIKSSELQKWLDEKSESPKALFFSEKGLVPPLAKALAIDFKDGIHFGFVHKNEKETVQKYDVKSFPSVVLLPGGDTEAIKYEGEVKKSALVDFFSQIMPPHADASGPAQKKAKQSNKTEKMETKETKSTPTSEAPSPSDSPMESPDPNVANNVPPPVEVPVHVPAKITSLTDEDALRKACLHSKSATCILAFVPAEDEDNKIVKSLEEIHDKHTRGNQKIFPFYSVPDSNPGSRKFTDALGLKDRRGEQEVVALNAKRNWWTSYGDESTTVSAIESWVEGIRVGDVKKEKIPDGVVVDEEEGKEGHREL